MTQIWRVYYVRELANGDIEKYPVDIPIERDEKRTVREIAREKYGKDPLPGIEPANDEALRASRGHA